MPPAGLDTAPILPPLSYQDAPLSQAAPSGSLSPPNSNLGVPQSPRKGTPLNSRWSSDDLQNNFRVSDTGMGGMITSTPYASLNRGSTRSNGKMSRRPQSADQDNKSASLDVPPDRLLLSPNGRASQRGRMQGGDLDLQGLDPDLAGILASRPASRMRQSHQKVMNLPLSEASSSRTPILTPEQVTVIPSALSPLHSSV